MHKVESNMEIEYKFWANLPKKEFHAMIDNAVGRSVEPIYVVSCDDYYVTSDPNIFLRHRKGGDTTELTLKQKRKGNIVRKEINLNLNNNDDSDIVEFLELSGYHKRFSVFKEAWIWEFEDADISYYTLSDGRSVIEIEATEYSTPSEGLEILDRYVEELELSKLSLERETRSLYEIFVSEKDSKQALKDSLFAFEI